MVHKYLLQRGQNWYFRWRVPAHLVSVFGRREIKRSLRTINRDEASARAAGFFLVVNDLKEDRKAFLGWGLDPTTYLSRVESNVKRIRKMTHNQFHMTEVIFKTPEGYELTVRDIKGTGRAVSGREDVPTTKPPAPPPEEAEVEQEKATLLFSELFQAFLAYKVKGGLSQNMQKECRLYFKTLLEIMGDKPVDTITRRSIKDALQSYRSLPKRNLKPYKGVPVVELLEMEVPEEHLVADKTVGQVKKLLQGVFSYAVQEELLKESPARDLKLNLSGSRTYGAFDDHEVIRLLESCSSEQQEWKRWIPLLGAFTGARRGELVQLRKQDVKLDVASNRHYLLITDEAGSVKTQNAIRQVPIHPNLISIGFLDFVEQSDDLLFPGLNPETVTSWFATKRPQLGIPAHDDYGNRKVFHSLRHTFITKSRAAGNPVEHVQQVVGHEKTSAGTTDRYTHTLPLASVCDVVDKVVFV